MNAIRKRRLSIILAIAVVLFIAIGLILYALRQNIRFYYTPTELAQNIGKVSNHEVWLGGMVKKGSIMRKGDLNVSFELTDFENSLIVHYRGVLPDLFRENQGIVVLGTLAGKKHFAAEKVLAKHDENYMPVKINAAKAG